MKVLVYLISILSIINFLGCSDSDSGTSTPTSNSGTAIQEISTAMESIATLASAFSSRGGVPTAYCNTNGGAQSSNTDLTNTDNNFASFTGFCQATHNSQSPDTPRGAMYIAGAIACIANQRGLFTTPGTNTETITIDTTCFGSQGEVDAMIADMGQSTITGASMTVAAFSGSAFDYTLTISGVGNPMTVHLKNSGGIKAALMDESGAPWGVTLDETNGVLYYEGINTTNNRRMRVRVSGTLSGGSFSAITAIDGFWLQGGGSWATFATFSGNTAGIIGNVYVNGGADITNECHMPGATANCTGSTAIASSGTDAGNLFTSMSADATSLVSNANGPVTFTTVDPTDGDIQQ